VRERVLEALRDWQLPSGEPVVARAQRREEVHGGPFCERAPDVVFELALDAGHGLSLVPTPWSEGGTQGEGIPSVRTLPREAWGGGRGRGMNGTHRPDGIWIATGPEASRRPAPARLSQVAPWLAGAMGLAWAAPGSAAREAGPVPRPYDAEEQAMVAERLRALGYLE
jgi:hypothetical protein